MINDISNSISSIPNSTESISGGLQGLQQPLSGQEQEPEASGGSKIEKEINEIEKTLAALAQELAQLTNAQGASQGVAQNGSDDQNGTPAISSGGSAPASPSLQMPEAADPGAGLSGPDAAGSNPGTAPAAEASGASGTAQGGAMGPNVPSALQPFMQDINAASQQTGVPASLIGAQILQESGGNPNAVTTNPALGLPDTGLMQVDQATFQGLQQQYPGLLGGKSVSDPATNIMAGALLDAQLLKQNNGNVSAALTAYNGNATPGYANEVIAKQNALENGTPVPGGFS
jgi:soluble lytic murein transglycosylase-like protein